MELYNKIYKNIIYFVVEKCKQSLRVNLIHLIYFNDIFLECIEKPLFGVQNFAQ